MKKKNQVNLFYYVPVSLPMLLVGFKTHSTGVVALGFIMLATLVIGGTIQKKNGKI